MQAPDVTLTANPRPPAPPGCETGLAELAALGLDPAGIGWRADAPPERAARELALIVDWVRTWQRCEGNRAVMVQRGYRFPPVDPDCDPEQDWLVFARWVGGQPLVWRFEEEYGALPPADVLDDTALPAQVEAVKARLAARNVAIELADRLPPRDAYAWLRQELQAHPLPFLAPATTLVIDGCSGDCEGCFQQAFCDLAEAFDET